MQMAIVDGADAGIDLRKSLSSHQAGIEHPQVRPRLACLHDDQVQGMLQKLSFEESLLAVDGTKMVVLALNSMNNTPYSRVISGEVSHQRLTQIEL